MTRIKEKNITSMNYIRNFYLTILKEHSFLFIAFIFFICMNNLCALFVSLFMKMFVDIASGQSYIPLLYAFFLSICNLLFLGISGTLVSILKNRLYCLSELGLRQEVVAKLYRISLQSFERKEPGTYLTNCTLDVERISKFTIETLFIQIFAECLTFIISLVLIFCLNWKLALFLTVLFPVFIYLIIKCSPVIDKWNQTIISHEEQNRNLLQEFLNNYVLFKSYSMQEWAKGKISSQYKGKTTAMAKLGFIQGGISFLNNFLGVGMFILALGLGSFFVLKGETTVGSLIAIVNLVSFYYGPFLHISGWIAANSEAKASTHRLNNIMNISEENIMTIPVMGSLLSIGTKNLSYQYPDKEHILIDISVEFKKGKSYAIQGESGSGKSTFLKNLSGLLTPTQGEVYYTSTNNVISQKSPNTQISYDSSAFSVFTGTIRENICMNLNEDQAQYLNALRLSNLENLINNISDDYFINVSGTNLSAGQLRRISLARVFYSNKEVLILDEPSSNLDTESIDVLIDAIKAVKKDRLIIIATHDPRLAESCDCQYRIINGRLNNG